VNFTELREARPARLATAAAEWRRMSEELSKLESQTVDDLVKPLRNSGWSGDGAAIAFRTLDRLDDEFELSARQARNVSIVLGWARAEFEKWQKQLNDKVAEATGLGLEVDQRGEVHGPRGYVSPTSDPAGYQRYQQLILKARQLNNDIIAILRNATQTDGDVARQLAQFQPRNPGEMAEGEWRDASFDARSAMSLMGLRESDIPAADTAPAQARAWWDGLTDEQRALYLTAHPDRVGALDGLPTPTRHSANMMALRGVIEAHMPSDGDTARLVGMLNRIEASEYGPSADRLYLLGFNNQLDGTAVVAVGNPDTARHLAVAVVPGIRTTLDGMDYQIDRAMVIRQHADNLTPAVEGDVSVVAWLGYDTPGLVTAPAHGYADTAAPVLDRFVDGTLVAQQGAGNLDSHRTIIGHSYGSTVVGLAASEGNGLAVHDIIVAGSPGMRVDSAAQLNLDPRHVWAGQAWNDGVPVIGPLSHGTAPHTEDFGANRFHVDTSGHSAYWAPNSQSLNNQAHIIVGQYNRVGLDHGRPPQ
jgi:hypothetical protein